MIKRIVYSPARRSGTTDYNDHLPLVDAKLHLRMDHDDDDDIIAIYRDAAMRTAEHETQRKFGEATYTFYIDRFPGDLEKDMITIPVLPVSEVVSVEYYDGSAWQTLNQSAYYRADLVSEPARIKFIDTIDVDEDTPMPIRVNVTAGYATGAAPQEMINGALMLLGHLYGNREDVVVGTIVSEVPKASQFLFGQVRIVY
jgi:uncharacterized phiE125 gp8 family phage protein